MNREILRDNIIFWSRLGFGFDPVTIDENGHPALFDDTFAELKFHQDFYKKGVKLHSFILNSGWVGVDKYDYTTTDATMDAAMKIGGDVKLIPRIKLNVPVEWCKENPEEVFVYPDGPQTAEEIKALVGTSKHDYLGYEAPVYISEQIPVGQTLGIDVPGELWKTFHRTKKQLPISFTNNIELGVSHSPDSENNSFMYFVGGSVPNIFLPHFDSMTPFILQPGKYIVCKIEADTFEFLVTNALYQANNYLYEIWLPQNKLTPSSFCAEKYFKGNTIT